MIVTTLGTSHGDHTDCRFNSSTLVEVDRQMYLFDAGAPVEALLIRARKKFECLRAVFITHMHYDHTGGLPGLLKTRVKWSKKPGEAGHTDVFLPEKGMAEPLSDWLKVQRVEWPSAVISLHTVSEGKLLDDSRVTVVAVPTRHLAAADGGTGSFAYVLEAGGKRVLHTGDLSSDFSDFPDMARREPCDLCICEAAHFDMDAALAILGTCPIGKLVFSHVGNAWHGEGEDQLRRMIAGLPFPCEIANDGDRFEVA